MVGLEQFKTVEFEFGFDSAFAVLERGYYGSGGGTKS